MPTRIAAAPARFVRSSVVAAFALSFLGIECVYAEPIFSVGAKETIYSASKRKSKAASWPDGNFGVLSNGDGTYDFYAANSSKIKVTSGTLNDPAAKKIGTGKIYNVPKKTYSYVAGGPIYEDPASGARLMVYHAEKHFGSRYSVDLGLAVSFDPKGLDFFDLGPIITPNIPVGQNPYSSDLGGGSFAIKDGQFNVYFRDYLANPQDGFSSELAVARAPLADLISNSLQGIKTPFTKYYNGGFTEPGIGGRSSPLEVGNPINWWSSVSYNEYLDQLVLVSSQWQSGGTGPDLYLATSADGVNWSARQPLVLDAGEQMYPTIVGTGADPQKTGQSFYVYYTDGKRWGSAQLARREVTFEPSVVPPPSSELGPMDWVSVSDYLDEFQPGGPAAGWQYAWNSNGQKGASAIYSQLVWSDVTQAYNTTGGAITVPTSALHNDDFVHLSAAGGHPGHPNFMPVVGYTIQADDGAGLYRLANSSIQKLDGTLSAGEDGLGVLVYVNDALMGPSTSVGTNGLSVNFDRELGQLNVGDTIRVMVSSLTNAYYDSFVNFDFSIQKGLPFDAGGGGSLMSLTAVPEPSSVVMLLMACGGCAVRWRKRMW